MTIVYCQNKPGFSRVTNYSAALGFAFYAMLGEWCV